MILQALADTVIGVITTILMLACLFSALLLVLLGAELLRARLRGSRTVVEVSSRPPLSPLAQELQELEALVPLLQPFARRSLRLAREQRRRSRQ